jgi:hypothetical protein
MMESWLEGLDTVARYIYGCEKARHNGWIAGPGSVYPREMEQGSKEEIFPPFEIDGHPWMDELGEDYLYPESYFVLANKDMSLRW